MEAFTVKRTKMWTHNLKRANAIITLCVHQKQHALTELLLNKVTNVPSHHHVQQPTNFQGLLILTT